jgi:hypothetical protein
MRVSALGMIGSAACFDRGVMFETIEDGLAKQVEIQHIKPGQLLRTIENGDSVLTTVVANT